jgi:hypothetical protein
MSPALALATVAGVIASGWPLGLLACRLDPGPLARQHTITETAEAPAAEEPTL